MSNVKCQMSNVNLADYKKYLEELLISAAESNASDLHLSPGNHPIIRVDGRLMGMSNKKILDSNTLGGLVSALLSNDQKTRFIAEKELDFSFELSKDHRFRVNTYYSRGKVAATMRLIPADVKSLAELNLPPVLEVFSRLSQGFVIVTGPNGHGKSTTMAALIDAINKERSDKIVTIEDPIEYIFSQGKSIIDQREVYQDTHSFHRALRSTFRENVNVVMIGEMRDYETMSAAVTAAETGHLIMASLHTNSAGQTIERIIDSFPSDQQSQIRAQLASTISGIVSQRLVPRIKGGLIPAVEVLIANSAVRTLIRDNRPEQLDLVIETNKDMGMISLNQSLASLIKRSEVDKEIAKFYTNDPAELEELIN
jgi:twitching motility protein PilT